MRSMKRHGGLLHRSFKASHNVVKQCRNGQPQNLWQMPVDHKDNMGTASGALRIFLTRGPQDKGRNPPNPIFFSLDFGHSILEIGKNKHQSSFKFKVLKLPNLPFSGPVCLSPLGCAPWQGTGQR